MLQKLSSFAGVPGPVVVIVMDGYGIPKSDVGSAIAAAREPQLLLIMLGGNEALRLDNNWTNLDSIRSDLTT